MKNLIKTILIIIIPICAAILLIMASERIGRGQEGESLKQLEDSLHKAVMTCYATEGVYPPSIEYVKDRYGIQVDEDRYSVFYEIFGSNIAPQITVMEKMAEEEE